MKIGFLIPYFYPKTGGAENNCYFTARELAKKHEVHVFCSGEKDSEEVIDKIHVHRSREKFRYRYYIAFYPGIVKKLLSTKLDVLHVHGFGFNQQDTAINKLKKRFPNIKLVCTPHGPFMALNRYPLPAKVYKKVYTHRIRKNLKKYNAIVQVNPNQKGWMNKEYGISKQKIHTIPNGITEESFKKIPKSESDKIIKKHGLKDKFVISYLGRIQEYKGLGQVVELLPELKKEKENLVLVGMGKDAGDSKRLKEIARKNSTSKNLVLTGPVSEKEKLAILDKSEIFVFPSEWEAFGIVVLEAMARKNVIVSTRTEGGTFLVEEGKNGYLFDYQNKKELLKKMQKTISSKKTRNQMKITNYQKSKQFLWKDIAKQLLNLYKSLK